MIYHEGKYISHGLHATNGVIKPILNTYHQGKLYSTIGLTENAVNKIKVAFPDTYTDIIDGVNTYLININHNNPLQASALTKFINEDPMLVCSLVNTGKTRWLYFENGGEIAMPRLLRADDIIEYNCIGEFLLFGRQGGASTPGFALQHLIGTDNIYAIRKYPWSVVYSPINALVAYHCTLNMENTNLYIEFYNGEEKESENVKFSWTSLDYLCTLSSYSVAPLKLQYLNISELHYVPFVGKEGDGLLDLNTATINPNITSDKFTIVYTNDDGTPWTPPV